MEFAKYLYRVINSTQAINEAAEPVKKESLDIAQIKSQLESKVGGQVSNKTAEETSYAAIKQALDLIPLSYLDNLNNPHIEEIVGLLLDKGKIDFLEKFTEKEKSASISIINKIGAIDRDRDETAFISLMTTYATVAERLLKIYKLLSSQVEETQVSEALTLDPKTSAKAKKIFGVSKDAATSSYNKILGEEEAKINAIPETPEGADRLERYKDLLDLLGLLDMLRGPVEKKEAKIKKEESTTTKNKKRILTRLIRGVQVSELPAVSNGEITSKGDYFKLFTSLEKKNPAWMELSLTNYVFKSEPRLASEFVANAKKTENPSEESQLNYLEASKEWIKTYIKSETDGDLTEKEKIDYSTKLQNLCLEKEKEIKNYYLSRDFNLGNFEGIQIKPEVRLPLYTRVRLTVTKEDRIKESPLRNIIKGVGKIISGLLSAIPDTGNEANAQQARKRNIAIFSGLNLIIRGGVTTVAGKQAGRDYAEKVKKIVPSTGEPVKEDMIAMTDAPGTMIVNPEVPGQIMQTPQSLSGGMDTFSLLGPGKKTNKKKKTKSSPKVKVNNKVSSFSDFMKRK